MKERVEDLISQLAQKLGVAAEHIWSVLVRQQIIEGTMDVIVGIILLCFAAVSIWGSRKTYLYMKKVEHDAYHSWDGSLYIALISVIVVAGGVITLIGFINLITGTKELLNPEYYVLRELMNLF